MTSPRAAGSSGRVGPNLDGRLDARDAKSLNATILNPPGSGPGTFSVMPDNFGARVNDRALDDLVGFLLTSMPAPDAEPACNAILRQGTVSPWRI